MQFWQEKYFGTNIKIVYSQVIEDEQFLKNHLNLTKQDKVLLSDMKNEKRKLQWLSYRYLLQKIIGNDYQIDYINGEKPILKNSSKFISISHSVDYVAVAISSQNSIGIDIEKMNDKILKLQEKIMQECEKQTFEHINKYLLHIIWGAKEAAYKQYYEYKINFFSDIFVKNIDFSQKKGEILIKNDHFFKETIFYFKQIDDYLLVVSL